MNEDCRNALKNCLSIRDRNNDIRDDVRNRISVARELHDMNMAPIKADIEELIDARIPYELCDIEVMVDLPLDNHEINHLAIGGTKRMPVIEFTSTETGEIRTLQLDTTYAVGYYEYMPYYACLYKHWNEILREILRRTYNHYAEIENDIVREYELYHNMIGELDAINFYNSLSDAIDDYIDSVKE